MIDYISIVRLATVIFCNGVLFRGQRERFSARLRRAQSHGVFHRTVTVGLVHQKNARERSFESKHCHSSDRLDLMRQIQRLQGQINRNRATAKESLRELR